MPISRIKTDGIQDDAITSAKIGDTNVATADIANSSVTAAKLAADAVTSAKLADDAVTSAKLADDAVTSAKLDTNIAVAGTLGVTGATTLNSNVAVNGGTGGQVATNFSSASTMGMKINDTNSGNLGGMLGFYSGSGAGTLRANIQNANNAGVHFSVGTGGSVVFTQTGYTAANALDDYEEGTFTPTFSFTNGNGNLTVASPTGHYIKVGNMVHIQGYIKLATRGTANGVCRIANIPFTNINSSSSYAAGSVWMNGMNNGAPMDGDFMQYLIINPGGDHMRLWCLSGNGTVHEATQGDVQDQSDFMFTVTYRHA